MTPPLWQKMKRTKEPLDESEREEWSSIQFIVSVMSYSLPPYGLQHTRLPCLSPTPGVYSNSCVYIYIWSHWDAEEEKRCDLVRTHIPNTVTHSQKKITTIGFPPEEWGAQASYWAPQPMASAPERKLPWCLALKASRFMFGRSRGQWETLLFKGSLALSPTQTEQQFKNAWIL